MTREQDIWKELQEIDLEQKCLDKKRLTMLPSNESVMSFDSK